MSSSFTISLTLSSVILFSILSPPSHILNSFNYF
nr:MAG TPA: hypothetical protein [Caudoviricetes sp.]